MCCANLLSSIVLQPLCSGAALPGTEAADHLPVDDDGGDDADGAGADEAGAIADYHDADHGSMGGEDADVAEDGGNPDYGEDSSSSSSSSSAVRSGAFAAGGSGAALGGGGGSSSGSSSGTALGTGAAFDHFDALSKARAAAAGAQGLGGSAGASGVADSQTGGTLGSGEQAVSVLGAATTCYHWQRPGHSWSYLWHRCGV